MFNKIRKFFQRKYNNNADIAEERGFFEKRKAKSAKSSKRSSPNQKRNPFLSAPSSRRGSGKVQLTNLAIKRVRFTKTDH